MTSKKHRRITMEKQNFHAMKEACEKTSTLTRDFLDAFLIPYTIGRARIETQFVRELSPYAKAISQMPQDWPGFCISLYATFLLFKKNGLGAEYAHHSVLKGRSPEEFEFMEFQRANPWRLSYFRVAELADPLFFEITDMFTEELCILYSPGIRDILDTMKKVTMVFLLIGFNGLCWQTYGPLIYFTGIQLFDVFFLARLLDPRIKNVRDVPPVIEQNPVPFMMLFIGANIPLTYHEDNLFVNIKSEMKKYDLRPDAFPVKAVIETRQHIYKISLPELVSFPHFAACYYHERKRHLVITAMTERGYNGMIDLLKESGHVTPAGADMFATMGMIATMIEYFPFKIDMFSPYEKTFTPPQSREDKKALEPLNAVLQDVMDAINSNRRVDARAIADKHGIDIELIQQIIENVKKSQDSVKKMS